ncbi:NAD(+) diphosphatase [Fulvimarina sp. MAC8]|uniref:NAD(+) diphosphatase n=1 Tax=Fulvimarina sp. MAC8 TaxID=3162874 RepID=UPI0032EE368E
MTQSTDNRTDARKALIGFTGNTLDRRTEDRQPGELESALAHPEACFHLHSASGFLNDVSGERPDPAFVRAAAENLGYLSHPDVVLLGYDAADNPVLASPIPDDAALPETIKQIDLRSLASQGVLDPETEGRLAQAQHLLLWHRDNRFCGKCGGQTELQAAGASRQCLQCDAVVFPRINPVSIMLIHDDAGRCILGRQPHFPENSWSCLAGFVEAGETLEGAVRRETLEEAGVEVGEVRYRFSQPWPFAGNLMIGFTARALSVDIRFDSNELEACRWFERDEVTMMLERTHPDGLVVPPPLAIAHHLIRVFVEETV